MKLGVIHELMVWLLSQEWVVYTAGNPQHTPAAAQIAVQILALFPYLFNAGLRAEHLDLLVPYRQIELCSIDGESWGSLRRFDLLNAVPHLQPITEQAKIGKWILFKPVFQMVSENILIA